MHFHSYFQSSTTSITSTAITSATTESSITPFFYCDFTNSSCFENGQISVTNGSEFNPSTLSYDTPPPRAPFSDVTSISKFQYSSYALFLNISIILQLNQQTITKHAHYPINQHQTTVRKPPIGLCRFATIRHVQQRMDSTQHVHQVNSMHSKRSVLIRPFCYLNNKMYDLMYLQVTMV